MGRVALEGNFPTEFYRFEPPELTDRIDHQYHTNMKTLYSAIGSVKVQLFITESPLNSNGNSHKKT